MNWKYVKPLKNETDVKKYLKGIITNDTIEFLLKNNGGRPEKCRFDCIDKQECVLKSLLSFNRDDIENVYAIYSSELKKEKLFPFALEANGNTICINIADKESIISINHKSNKKVMLADTFNTFINSLY